MDIKIENTNHIFKYRVNGILIHNNKILTVQIMDNGIYCLPGGHVKIGEDSISAIKREMKEECNYYIKDTKLFVVADNFFTRKNDIKVHELSFYYLINSDDIKEKDYITYELEDNENKKLEFKWIKLNELDKYSFKPKFLIEKLNNHNFDFEYIINKS